MIKKITKIENKIRRVRKTRVAAYCRVSTDSEEQLVSLEAQKQYYEKYITSNPEWDYVGLYYDEGISGTKKEKRPALMQMIKDCEESKIDFIVTKSISRFARNTSDCLELVSYPPTFEKEYMLQHQALQLFFQYCLLRYSFGIAPNHLYRFCAIRTFQRIFPEKRQALLCSV